MSGKLILGSLDVETGETNNNKAWDHETRDNGAVTGTRGIRHSVKLDVSRLYDHINFGIPFTLQMILVFYYLKRK